MPDLAPRHVAVLLATLLAGCASVDVEAADARPEVDRHDAGLTDDAHGAVEVPASAPPLGAFSISLTVSDLAASREFYELLGFEAAGGMPEQGWQILRSGDTVIGLFQGMFEKNILTFNPGWTQQATAVESFTDVRETHRRLAAAGVTFDVEMGLDGDGPASFVITDPDGNPVLFDQHVPRPE